MSADDGVAVSDQPPAFLHPQPLDVSVRIDDAYAGAAIRLAGMAGMAGMAACAAMADRGIWSAWRVNAKGGRRER